MTVTERPLYGRLELERFHVPTVDVPASIVRTWENTTNTTSVWTASLPGTLVGSYSGSTSGVTSSRNSDYTADAEVSMTLTGLTVGKKYSVEALIVKSSGSIAFNAKIGIAGKSFGPVVSAVAQGSAALATPRSTLTYTFRATSATHNVLIHHSNLGAGGTSATAISITKLTLISAAWAQPQAGYWVPYIADATRCSIRRGGTRSGLGIKTDVGTMSFTLHNAQDPLNGGAFKSGQTVRATVRDVIFHPEVGHWGPGPEVITGYEPVTTVPAQQVYSQDFSSGSYDSWTTGVGGGIGVSSARLRVGRAVAPFTTKIAAYRDFTGLTVGRSYTLSADWMREAPYVYNARLGDNTTWGTSIIPNVEVWERASYTFTATATTKRLYMEHEPGGASTSTQSEGLWDNITLTRNAYEAGGDPIYGPGPDVWVVDEEAWTEVTKTTPIFTGTVSDVKASYPLDKATGKKRTSVTVEVSDAVKVHATTPRYGAMIGAPYYETFEQRITRLAGSALAPIEPPPVGTPKVVYSF